MESYSIPSFLISAVADTVSESETHASLDSLFMYADAPGEPPEGSKAVKALEWLRRLNKESGIDRLLVLGRIIEKYMEEELGEPSLWITQEQIESKKRRISNIRKALERAGLNYSQGGILSKGEGLATKTLSELIKNRNIQAVDFEFERAIKNVESSPREAISAACNILESVFKVYIEEHDHLRMPTKQDLQSVWKVVKSDLGLDASILEERDLQEIVSGIMAAVNGIGALRTHASSAHGAGKRPYNIKPRHAKLAIHSAHTIAAFVLETWDERTRKGNP
ncbi:ATP-dependent RNA helicase HrpA [Pseudomonas putida]|uniref:abortive infection family protein n=1 Tax=Pseudomonas putida TaxID=303 RepID=UPI00159DA85C|nr:abortive infection family protein [Pseudomonas putida]NVN63938.1 ATP-dependent RNA helicase HrpA [Pseudomonas putida]NVN68874.1 ATP-dependent RNA helicase HrpA [Pseudomonas putida]